MTADELASFRALLRAQVEVPQRRRLFAARERPPAVAAASGAPAAVHRLPAASSTSELLLLATAPADPPPRAPPLFGRREAEVVACERDQPLTLVVAAEPLMLRTALAISGPDQWEVPATMPESRPDPAKHVAPGGWTRARPPSAQRRLMARLEAVFLAERQGLDARRQAQRG